MAVRVSLSLRNRVFLACAFVAAIVITIGTLFVTQRVSTAAEAQLLKQLAQSGEIVEEQHRDRLDTLRLLASLIADLPKLKAAVSTNDAPTVAPIAIDYMRLVGSDFVSITNDGGETLAAFGPFAFEIPEAIVEESDGKHGSTSFHQTPGGAVEIVTYPITIGQVAPERLGTLSFGFSINEDLAERLGNLSQSDVIIVTRERVLASTLSLGFSDAPRLFDLANTREIELAGKDWVALPVALFGEEIRAVTLLSRNERSAFLSAFRQGVILAAALGALLAILLSYVVARTVTQPLGAIARTMREISETGDLARKIDLVGRWQDEDTRLVATTFNRLTASIARFQRESAVAERLSALGRMSAVLAHEIRNPLMIIKASLRAIRRPSALQEDVDDALQDIDHEVDRLNWMVGEVLDFARPLRVDNDTLDLTQLCQKRADALALEDPTLRLAVELDPNASAIVSDVDLLERAIVNVLSNAKDAVHEIRRTTGEPPPDKGVDIVIATRARGVDQVAVVVEDHGIGIGEDELELVFEPYFTGKRTGTGLGLAITKNIVESLGGIITAASDPVSGTQIAMLLPKRPEAGVERRLEQGALS